MARDAFSSGLTAGAATAAVIAAVGAVLAATLLRHVPPTGSAISAPADDRAQPDDAEADNIVNR